MNSKLIKIIRPENVNIAIGENRKISIPMIFVRDINCYEESARYLTRFLTIKDIDCENITDNMVKKYFDLTVNGNYSFQEAIKEVFQPLITNKYKVKVIESREYYVDVSTIKDDLKESDIIGLAADAAEWEENRYSEQVYYDYKIIK